MQIHELTLKEGVLDKIKGAATGALSQFGTGAIPQTGGVATSQTQPFTGQTAAQARAKTTQLNPASAKKFGDILWQAWTNEVTGEEKRLAHPLDDASYRNLLRKFIDQVFFKDKMELLVVSQKQTIEHAIDTITKLRDNPEQQTRNFATLSQSFSNFKPDRRAALDAWKGKVLDVNLQPRNGGVSRAAKFSWDGTHWIDAFSGQRATEELSKDLTNVALGTLR